jgi:cytochrome P450
MNSDNFQKSEVARSSLARLLGEGILVVEGDKHKQQRKILNPAFGPAQIRELAEIFVEKSIELRDIWLSDIAKNSVDGSARIEVLSWLSRTTLDIIGLAGFNYKFDTLNVDGKPNELNEAFSTVFRSTDQIRLSDVLKSMFPFFRIFRSQRDVKEAEALHAMKRIGTQLLRESKAALEATSSEKGGSVGKNSMRARDLLSLLIRANMATDLPDNQRLDDADVLAQVPTFLVAGHETTSTATTWALYALTQNQAAQTKLRTELLTVTSNPTTDELNALPYLDYVVRETLRLHTPVPTTMRMAVKDDALPLKTPYVDSKGVAHDAIRVRKGDMIFIPILALNRSRELWGEDSREFKPERWESLPEAVGSIPGVWGNILTFLGGPRACIGYRFALLEMKVLLFTLVRAFEFELAVPAKDIIKKTSVVQRPVVLSDPEGANQMPLLIKPYTQV